MTDVAKKLHLSLIRVKSLDNEYIKAFENSNQRHAPQAAILYDKFQVTRPLDDALDKGHRMEYVQLASADRHFIKGRKHTLLSLQKPLGGWTCAFGAIVQVE